MPAELVRALLIEDNPGDARLFVEMLGDMPGFNCNLEQVDRLSTGLARLQDGGIDVVVLDLTLPDSSGFETFQRLHAQVPHLPVVLLTGLDDEELGASAVREGAQEYLARSASFVLPNGVSLIGGFAGFESSLPPQGDPLARSSRAISA